MALGARVANTLITQEFHEFRHAVSNAYVPLRVTSGDIQRKLAIEPPTAVGHLQGQRTAVARRPALEDVEHRDLGARQVDRFEGGIERLPGTADERNALRVFIGARAFADKDQGRFGIADSEDDLAAALMQAAAAAVADVFDDFEKRIVGRGEGRKVHSDDGTGGDGRCLRRRRRDCRCRAGLAVEGLNAQVLVKLKILA